jgi:chorismate synthase
MIGKLFCVSVYGESHGKCIGTLIEGCPPGIKVSEEDIAKELSRRRPKPPLGTSRVEPDKFEILSGVFNGYTTGAPINIVIWNKDIDPGDYELFKRVPRPSHADYVARVKYRGYNDYRGGGIFSGRLTAAYVAAGVIAKKLLERFGVKIAAHIVQIGDVYLEKELSYNEIMESRGSSPIECGDGVKAKDMIKVIDSVKKKGDSIGGVVEAIAIGLPVGLGEPIFDRLDGEIAKALFAIPGVKGVEFGAGFKLACMWGSEANDQYTLQDGKVVTITNNSGGIVGGISNGMPIKLRVVFKPTPSIAYRQKSIDLDKMEETYLEAVGRFDPCIATRTPPIVEAVLGIVLADHILRWNAWRELESLEGK